MNLSTYGLLRHQKEKDIVDTINYLLSEGLFAFNRWKVSGCKSYTKCGSCPKRRRKHLDEKDPLLLLGAYEEREENQELFEILRVLRKKLLLKNMSHLLSSFQIVH